MTAAAARAPLPALASLFLLLSPRSAAANSFDCADALPGNSWSGATRDGAVSSVLAFTVDPADAAGTVSATFDDTSVAGQLCTLFLKTYSEDVAGQARKAYYTPVGRSYDGRPWEVAAGRHAEVASFAAASGSTSAAVLPYNPGDEYHLAAYAYDLTPAQAWSRFLERATFGPTGAAVADLVAAGQTFEGYLAEQNDVAPTSHREYFRKRLNPRSLETYKYGRAGPHPCAVHSRWRKFAFTRKDKVMSQSSGGDIM